VAEIVSREENCLDPVREAARLQAEPPDTGLQDWEEG
jgi:hypothetical protein